MWVKTPGFTVADSAGIPPVLMATRVLEETPSNTMPARLFGARLALVYSVSFKLVVWASVFHIRQGVKTMVTCTSLFPWFGFHAF